MSYQLGVDLGTTYTAAAVFRDGAATIFTLGTRNAAIPSVVLLRADGTILVGDAAERRAMTEPERVAREFKRRLGDTTPIIVGGAPHTAEALTAKLLESVVEAVAAREGGQPSRIVITHPANWGNYKRDLLSQAVRLAGLDPDDIEFLTEPEAAAISYAAQERIEPGEIVAVYDLGGGTFDTAVLERTPAGFSIVGKPEGIERLGGIDFDAAVFRHVTAGLGSAMSELDTSDPTTLAAVARLRQDCVEAKEALSSDADASLAVLLPTLQTEVRITRQEFESLIRSDLLDTIEAMRRAIASAGLQPEDVSRVLLVGGSSRIPLVSLLVGSELGRPPSVDAHPKHAIALGAAFAASGIMEEMSEAPVPAADAPVPSGFNPKMTVVAPAHLYHRGALEGLGLDRPSVRSKPLPIEGRPAASSGPAAGAVPQPSPSAPFGGPQPPSGPVGRAALPVEGSVRRQAPPSPQRQPSPPKAEPIRPSQPPSPPKAEPIRPSQPPSPPKAEPIRPSQPPPSRPRGFDAASPPPAPGGGHRQPAPPPVEDNDRTAIQQAVPYERTSVYPGGRPPSGSPSGSSGSGTSSSSTAPSAGRSGPPWLLLAVIAVALAVAGVLLATLL